MSVERVKIAHEADEVKAALKVVYDAYLRQELIQPNEYGMRILPHHLLPTTEIYIGLVDDVVNGALTFVRDGKLGLPLEEIYENNVASRRDRGLSIGEATCLARDDGVARIHAPLVSKLMRFGIQCAIQRDTDSVLIALHPTHAKSFVEKLGFSQIAGEQSYPFMGNLPAVLLELDLTRLVIDHPEAHWSIFEEGYTLEELAYHEVSDEVRNDLRAMLERGA